MPLENKVAVIYGGGGAVAGAFARKGAYDYIHRNQYLGGRDG